MYVLSLGAICSDLAVTGSLEQRSQREVSVFDELTDSRLSTEGEGVRAFNEDKILERDLILIDTNMTI